VRGHGLGERGQAGGADRTDTDPVGERPADERHQRVVVAAGLDEQLGHRARGQRLPNRLRTLHKEQSTLVTVPPALELASGHDPRRPRGQDVPVPRRLTPRLRTGAGLAAGRRPTARTGRAARYGRVPGGHSGPAGDAAEFSHHQ